MGKERGKGGKSYMYIIVHGWKIGRNYRLTPCHSETKVLLNFH